MPGSVVDLSDPNRRLPDVVVVDTNVLVERLLASYVDDLPPSPVAVNAERAGWFFRTLTSSGVVGIVTPTVFTEFVHAAVKAHYKQERRRLGSAAVQTYGHPVRACYGLWATTPTSFCSIRQAKARKCSPSSVEGNRS